MKTQITTVSTENIDNTYNRIVHPSPELSDGLDSIDVEIDEVTIGDHVKLKGVRFNLKVAITLSLATVFVTSILFYFLYG